MVKLHSSIEIALFLLAGNILHFETGSVLGFSQVLASLCKLIQVSYCNDVPTRLGTNSAIWPVMRPCTLNPNLLTYLLGSMI